VPYDSHVIRADANNFTPKLGQLACSQIRYASYTYASDRQEHLQNKTTQARFRCGADQPKVIAMIDRQMMDSELELARAARREAESALTDVDEMIWELQHFQPGRQRLVFSIAGFDEDLDQPPVAA